MSSTSPTSPPKRDPDPASANNQPSSSSAPPPKRTRSRNGCLVCRARRIKCDLECRRCINYSAQCVYPVKKAFDPKAVDAALGSRHNRPSNMAATAAAYQDNFLPPRQTPSPPLNQIDQLAHAGPSHDQGPFRNSSIHLPPRADRRRLLDSVQPLEMVHALFRKTKMGNYFNNPNISPPEFLSHAFPEPEDLKCLAHAFSYALSITVIDEDHNPWIEHLAPMFLFPSGEAPLSVSALKYSVLAIGATHLSFFEAAARSSEAEHTLELSKRYRHTALGLLRQARRTPGELGHDAFLAASLMIVDNDPLRYAKAAIAHRGGAGNLLFGRDWRQYSRRGVDAFLDGIKPPPPARRYLIEHAVMHDLLSCFSTGDPPTVLDQDSSWWELLGTTGSTDREWESLESLVGFDRSMVRLAATVLTLYSRWRKFEAHYRPLNELDPAVSLHSPAAMERMELSRQLTNVQVEMSTWRSEAPARYMAPRTMIGSMTLWHGMQIILLRDMQKRGRDDADVQSSASAILELCIEVGDKVEFLNWSLIVACSVLLDLDKRNVARGVMKTFAYQCCHELEVSREIIEEMWKRIDQGYDDESSNWREVAIEIGRPAIIG
ncbi:hypothetical protein A1Q2_04215 [Trichosporon asahii var. asahii CBS 8904]|uniref:Zn(2)-C6 fungal-type domain-containing protein n=1 Tax=Trichosporon asahii var. asahii (strain CBS 8904) TaxID=1220162 RepID=K1VL36_TRIAC|nr:hypothetical protein A1Q2_04215 [Trichosporon asahii var. asahii CBS 8904]